MKDKQEERFDILEKQYRMKFKQNYPLMITSSMSLKEVCDDIEKCIKNNKIKNDFPYKKGATY